ncbi:putative transcription factor MADS-type1 family [Arabidopsis thaliana]|uniref:AGAMOUS-like 33 n=2 Tax=Arabidopsis TaxID=3701 RepID=O64840_ARATH|nr:AGAMOUS-like 33 [Arabidopsis thaliana]AAC14519.1 MADS-box protein (AGL33) [Arabidopsis thaliana]AAN52797.1 MADS-box protein AGL33 [Arabidopsis thaliana]AEC07824.1 AGAMOUS-like 33 [Arabidopsis thaliana]KAG7637514.1 Transcription factor MADS-box [Arabidopsis thaliana x Arabidopsis arenosa]|eukprot:NP_180200.1 AGAMOUS-like 33 [Arabidopsis thaliana]
MKRTIKNKNKQIVKENMGRKKLKLKRIESLKERSSKFSKRKKGLFKKAEEVALLCDSDIMLIVVSPTEKPTVFNTRSRSFHTILERFCMLSLQEREERCDLSYFYIIIT